MFNVVAASGLSFLIICNWKHRDWTDVGLVWTLLRLVLQSSVEEIISAKPFSHVLTEINADRQKPFCRGMLKLREVE
jgi:hypothetical protein